MIRTGGIGALVGFAIAEVWFSFPFGMGPDLGVAGVVIGGMLGLALEIGYRLLLKSVAGEQD